MHPSLQHDRFLIRRKILTFIGRKMHTYDEMMNLLLFTHMKGFKLKEDITVYADIERQEPLLRIRARRIIDIAATYDIHDVSGGGEVHIGALKRKGLKSFVRDEWLIFDTQDREIGLIQEDSSDLALVRRFISAAALVLPQSYNFTLHGRPVGFMKQNFNPFVMKLTADFTEDIEQKFDRRLAAAAATLLCCIEGKQR
ncbi:hypothetical protein KQI84_02005 [bacterium]|nr:hypothetical protein [bacterium]